MSVQTAFWGKREEREGQCGKLTMSDLSYASAISLSDTKPLLSTAEKQQCDPLLNGAVASDPSGLFS